MLKLMAIRLLDRKGLLASDYIKYTYLSTVYVTLVDLGTHLPTI